MSKIIMPRPRRKSHKIIIKDLLLPERILQDLDQGPPKSRPQKVSYKNLYVSSNINCQPVALLEAISLMRKNN
jgi:hypothetical protein